MEQGHPVSDLKLTCVLEILEKAGTWWLLPPCSDQFLGLIPEIRFALSLWSVNLMASCLQRLHLLPRPAPMFSPLLHLYLLLVAVASSEACSPRQSRAHHFHWLAGRGIEEVWTWQTGWGDSQRVIILTVWRGSYWHVWCGPLSSSVSVFVCLWI